MSGILFVFFSALPTLNKRALRDAQIEGDNENGESLQANRR